MVTTASVDQINADPAKKKALLKDLDDVLKKHNVALDPKYTELLAKPDPGKIGAAMSSWIITITA